ncbi:MAG: hypothetical protein FWE13_03870 [Firmicutes bacterium]|nr:hypothetical protein [Bacillota bacterium]
MDSKKRNWITAVEKVLVLQFKGIDGVVATSENIGRIVLSIACERDKKPEAKKIISSVLKEMYLTRVKYEYLKYRLKITQLSEMSSNLLLHSLVAFDRESEGEIIERELKFGDCISLEGFFNFRLGELKERWNEIASLATNNAIHLHQDETLNELLKFLMSAVTPKIQKLSIEAVDNRFSVKGLYKKNHFEFSFFSSDQLMIYLINVAPLELTLEGEFSDKKLYNRIVSIFDGKSG